MITALIVVGVVLLVMYLIFGLVWSVLDIGLMAFLIDRYPESEQHDEWIDDARRSVVKNWTWPYRLVRTAVRIWLRK